MVAEKTATWVEWSSDKPEFLANEVSLDAGDLGQRWPGDNPKQYRITLTVKVEEVEE